MIPQAVERHKNAVLKCVYNMEGETLYSIKWYKGQNEFFRYTPGENPPEKVFSLRGVNVLVRIYPTSESLSLTNCGCNALLESRSSVRPLAEWRALECHCRRTVILASIDGQN